MSSSRSPLRRSESLHRQVARNIRNDIEAGILRDGDVLPSTRELAARWGVSVFTISEAMKLLAAEGLIVSKDRAKRVVRAPRHRRRSEIRLTEPRVILIGGYAGCGKSELGRILARKTGWPILDKDTITRPVVEIALETLGQPPHDRESEAYMNTVRPREYEALLAAVIENVECGNSVIATAPFVREFRDPVWIDRVSAQLAARNARPILVWVHCDPDTMHTYIRHRAAARDAAKLADWPSYLGSLDLDFRPPRPHVVIDNSASSRPLHDQAHELLATVLTDAETA